MGTRGPVPKRDANRAGHNAKSERADTVVASGRVAMPEPDPSWAPEARDWYLSLERSGQSFWYEPSDWRYHYVTAKLLSDVLTSSRPSAQMMSVVDARMRAAGSTEADRRRMRIEVERDRPEPGSDPGATDDAKSAVLARFAALRGDG